MDYYTATRKNQLKPTWINLKNLTLNKTSHPQKTERYDVM